MGQPVALIIPALDEEAVIGETLDSLADRGLAQIIVVDNGSRDRTAEVARGRGAQVIPEPRRGYGQACLAGIAAIEPRIEIIAFMDADGSDDPDDLPQILAPLERDEADLVIGSRALGKREPGSEMPQQAFGNWLASRLLLLFHGLSATDLGPFRAIRRDSLATLGMRDTNFGWTIEMQIKARQRGLRVVEVPARYRRRRAGHSKVSGTVRGTLFAGAKILWTILRYRVSG